MLPRVSAALVQFIAPIATSARQGLTQQGFERFAPQAKGKKRDPSQQQQQPKQEQSQPGQQQAKILPFPGKEDAARAEGAGNAKSSGSSIPAGISNALLQILDMFKEQRMTIMRWIGTSSYQLAARQQKKNGRIRKGTILDEKAE